MQDSLEDYIRLVRNTTKITLNDGESKVSWERKQQCESYAYKIVEFMIEGKLQPQVFIKGLNFIHPEHYQDIVEERAVSKLCGYPLCGKRLPQMPKKQFHISTKQNRIYDITDRKSFCCNYCYQASEFVKRQIDSSPLWLRNLQDFKRKIILLDQNEILRPGVEIDHGLAKPPSDKTDVNFTSVNSFTECCLDEAEQMELNRLMREKEEEEEEIVRNLKKKTNLGGETIEIIEEDSQLDKPKSILKKKTGSTKKDGNISEIDGLRVRNIEKGCIKNDDNDCGNKGVTEEVKYKSNDCEDKGVKIVESLKREMEIPCFEEFKERGNCIETPVKVEIEEKRDFTGINDKILIDNVKQMSFVANKNELVEIEGMSEINIQLEESDKSVRELQERKITEVELNDGLKDKRNSIQSFVTVEKENHFENTVQSKFKEKRESSINFGTEELTQSSEDKQEFARSFVKIDSVQLNESSVKVETEEQREFIQSSVNVGVGREERGNPILISTKGRDSVGSNNDALKADKLEILKKTTIVPDYAVPSTSACKSVRFKLETRKNDKFPKKASEEEIAELTESMNNVCKYLGIKMPTTQKQKIAQKENQKTVPNEKQPAAEINEDKMRRVIEKINAREKDRVRKVCLIETTNNPEENQRRVKLGLLNSQEKSAKKRTEVLLQRNSIKETTKPVLNKEVCVNEGMESLRIGISTEETTKSLTNEKSSVEETSNRKSSTEETLNEKKSPIGKITKPSETLNNPDYSSLPKYAHKIVEKIKPLQKEDENLKRVIEKVKNLTINPMKEEKEDKLKSILEKIKRKEESAVKKEPILIPTQTNPEIEQPLIKKKDLLKPKEREIHSCLDKIRLCLLQWLTLETYVFIHGEAKIKSVLNKQALDDYFERLKISELETAKQVKYMNICKKLQLRELAEEKFDGVLLNTLKQRKPLPDYSRLKEESKEMDVKVKAFFTGTVYERTEPNIKNKKRKDDEEEGGGEESPAVLPLVDAGSQNAIRKKIFINAVNKYVQVHVKELDLDEGVLVEVQAMVKTFKLEADNIVFKPRMWNVIGFVLIVMMSRKCDVVRDKLLHANADTYRELLFSRYEDWTQFLEKVLHIIERVDVYVENYIVSD